MTTKRYTDLLERELLKKGIVAEVEYVPWITTDGHYICHHFVSKKIAEGRYFAFLARDGQVIRHSGWFGAGIKKAVRYIRACRFDTLN